MTWRSDMALLTSFQRCLLFKLPNQYIAPTITLYHCYWSLICSISTCFPFAAGALQGRGSSQSKVKDENGRNPQISAPNFFPKAKTWKDCQALLVEPLWRSVMWDEGKKIQIFQCCEIDAKKNTAERGTHQRQNTKRFNDAVESREQFIPAGTSLGASLKLHLSASGHPRNCYYHPDGGDFCLHKADSLYRITSILLLCNSLKMKRFHTKLTIFSYDLVCSRMT